MTVYIPILRTVVTQAELMSAGLSSAIVIRVWFRGASWATGISPVPGPLAISAFSIIATTTSWDPSRSQQIVQRYTSGPPQTIRYANPQFQREVVNIVSASPFMYRLSSMNGLVSSISVCLRDLTQSVFAPILNLSLSFLHREKI